jgi:hypothetical protein
VPGAKPFALPQPAAVTFPAHDRWGDMADNHDDLHARLRKLADLVELARLSQVEDRARMERSIRLIIRALQLVAQFRQKTQRGEAQREAEDAFALCRRIAEQARAAGLRVSDNDNHE